MEANKEKVFGVIDILEQKALFTEQRVDKATVPDGVYCYALRHGDDDSFPVALEKKVAVNYFGAVLLTRELQFGEKDYISIGFADYGFTEEEMTVEEFVQKYGSEEATAQEPKPFVEGRDLAAYVMLSFDMSIKEADTLFRYLTEHDYAIGHRNNIGLFLRNELREWKECSIDDVIQMVCDWNYEKIQSTEIDLEGLSSEEEAVVRKGYCNALREDEKVLDALYDRTKNGKEIERIARKLASKLIQHSNPPEELDSTVKQVAEKLREQRPEE